MTWHNNLKKKFHLEIVFAKHKLWFYITPTLYQFYFFTVHTPPPPSRLTPHASASLKPHASASLNLTSPHVTPPSASSHASPPGISNLQHYSFTLFSTTLHLVRIASLSKVTALSLSLSSLSPISSLLKIAALFTDLGFLILAFWFFSLLDVFVIAGCLCSLLDVSVLGSLTEPTCFARIVLWL